MKLKDIKNNPYVTDENKFWIGQGYGYKVDNWDKAELDDIVYIPEYGYDTDEEGREYIEHAYTKQDFLDLCEGNCCCTPYVLFEIKQNREYGQSMYVLKSNVWKYRQL